MQRRANSDSVPPSQRTLLVRPPDRNCLQKLKDFLYDKKTGTCLTRTPVNWFAITIYYSLFLLAVFLMFYVSLMIVMAVASNQSRRPQYLLQDSFIGESPSLNFFPVVNSRNLIWLSAEHAFDKYVDTIEDMFDNYTEANSNFNLSEFKNCSSPPYGYDEKAPCIFFRLNRILLWKPKPFKQTDRLPKNLPENVQKFIKGSPTPKIWITCEGTTSKDRDHITQDFFHFQGDNGFDVSGFPFDQQEDFIDPIVALKFKDDNPKKTLYSFTCVAWAKKLDQKQCKVEVTYYIE